MSAYRGHLTTVVGDGPEVVIKLSGDSVRVMTPDGRVHTWPSTDVRVTGISGDRFWIAFQGEIAVFAPEQPEAFMLEFLPGLKTARTVAEAIEAANTLQADETEVAPPPAVTAESETDEVEANGSGPRRVAAHRARLPQLSEHVAANGHGTVSAALDDDPTDISEAVDRAPDPDRRWWSRGQSAPPLRSDEPAAAEHIDVDLTDTSLGATLSAAIGRAEADTADDRPELPDDPPPPSNLLRSLADKKQAYDAGRRGTYKPRR